MPEQTAPVPGDARDGVGAEQLGGVLICEHSLDDLLELVVALARRTLAGVDGVSVSLSRQGKRYTSNSSDEVVNELDEVQYRLREGPCHHAMTSGRSTSIDLEAEPGRYPGFGEVARQRFMTAVLSVPLTVREDTIGALNFYSSSVRQFRDEDSSLAALFARQASIMLANGIDYAPSRTLNETLREALATREIIGEAKGIVMARAHCSPDEAFDQLRQISQRENRKLRVVAEELVASVESARDDPMPRRAAR